MTREIIEINDFIILIEGVTSDQPITDSCKFDESLIAVAFYGKGNVDLKVNYGGKDRDFHHTRGLVLSFYADEQVEFVHNITPSNPLESIVIATAPKNLSKLPNQEGELFAELLHQLVHPQDHFVPGPYFFMTPEMHDIVEQLFKIPYQGKAKMMFLRSQITVLLSHFFGQLASLREGNIKPDERQKLFEAKEILAKNLDSPPSLSELSRQIGLNSFKLKKNFKALFGVPVFKYLQNERLKKAHDLLRAQRLSVQEAAWEVGYDSLSSFSHAFAKKYGYRPSEIRTL